MSRKPLIRGAEKRRAISLLAKGESIRNTADRLGRSPKAIMSLKNNNRALIDAAKDRINMRIIEEAEPSINKMVELRDGADSQTVQLQAAKELLDKAESRTGINILKHTPMVINYYDQRKQKEDERKVIELKEEE